MKPAILAIVLRRPLLISLAGAALAACTASSQPATRLELARSLVLVPIHDPQGALTRLARAVETDPMSGLRVATATLPGDEAGAIINGPDRRTFELYQRAHTDLDAPDSYRYAYERERDEHGDERWRVHCLASSYALLPGDLVDARIVEDPHDGRPRIRVELGPDDRKDLAELTASFVGRRIAVVTGDEVLMAPLVTQPLLTGVLEISPADRSRPELEALFKQLFRLAPQ